MKYPEHFKYRAPQINLPFSKPTIIFSFYNLSNGPDGKKDLRKIASCKSCEKEIDIISGSHVNSSFTFGLVFHLQNHEGVWKKYLESLGRSMTADSKTKYEHFVKMEARSILSKEESNKKFQEFQLATAVNDHYCNPAGIPYKLRDRIFLKNDMHLLAESQNAQMFEYMFNFTNKSVTLFDLMGTKHPNASLRENYKRSKCFVDNIGNITVDLQKLLCPYVCFHDPELYDQCPNEHTGDIATFAKKEYQDSFENLSAELDNYPEFLNNKMFDYELLKTVRIVEHDRIAVVEMNRLVKILVSMIKVRKRIIRQKINQVKFGSTDENNLLKPPLAINNWGPKYSDIDIPEELDQSKRYNQEMFSTFKHANKDDCPAYKDNSKALYFEPVYEDEKFKYPCDIGGCKKDCECDPCMGKEPLICPEHNPDHPLLFDPDEDLVISRRLFVDPVWNETISRRPLFDARLSPPDLLLAGLKAACKICKHNVNNHLKHHHTLHPQVCDICRHKEFISKNSFELICYICLKSFKSKYRLKDHLQIHNLEENPNYCKACEKGFVTKYNFERHIMENHQSKEEEFSCNVCAATFTAERNLERHIHEFHNDSVNADFLCDLCEKSYKRKDNLLKHKRIEHNQDKRKVHMPGVSENINPHHCLVCDKTFKQKYTLDRHIETIHMQNSGAIFQCETCSKSFRRKDKLQSHKRTHLLAAPRIICELCQKEFATKDDLRAHRISYHEKNK